VGYKPPWRLYFGNFSEPIWGNLFILFKEKAVCITCKENIKSLLSENREQSQQNKSC